MADRGFGAWDERTQNFQALAIDPEELNATRGHVWGQILAKYDDLKKVLTPMKLPGNADQASELRKIVSKVHGLDKRDELILLIDDLVKESESN